MAFTTSPNMFLVIPGVGSQQGPDYALNLNSDLSLIDQHDHSLGKGVQITPSGLNINSNLSFNSNYLTDVGGVKFTALVSNPSDLQFLYVAPGPETPLTEDLWFNDGNGNQVQLTSNGLVNATIASLPGESYSAGTFFWKQGAGSTTPANFDIGSITIRPNVAATANGVRLVPPSGITSQYDISLPLLPGAKSVMFVDNSGVITTDLVTGSNIAATTITGSNLVNNTITATQIANNTIDIAQLAADVLQWNTQTLSISTPGFNVRLATTANGTLATAFANGQTIDGSVLVTGNVILLKNQTTTTDNGVYTVNASGAPTRSTSYNTFTQLNYAGVHVTAGTANTGLNFFQNNILTTLTDAQSWSQSQTIAFTVPVNVNRLNIQACGAGGGGGGAFSSVDSAQRAGGGGGGATPMSTQIAVTAGDIINVTVGFKGLGGIGSVSGTTGADSKVQYGTNSLLFKGGSLGVAGQSGISGAGGSTYPTPVYGSLVPSGGGGGASGGIGGTAISTFLVPIGAGSTPSGVSSGGGGGSGFGIGGVGGPGTNTPGTGAGASATNSGAGGGGGGAVISGQGNVGGNGADGQVIISWLGHA